MEKLTCKARCGWLLAAGCLLLVSCHALAQDAVQYQLVALGDNGWPTLYAVNTETKEVAKWDEKNKTWSPAVKFQLPDWDAIRKQREVNEKADAKRLAEQAERQAKQEAERQAFIEAFLKKPLTEQVAEALDIVVFTCVDGDTKTASVTRLKGEAKTSRDGNALLLRLGAKTGDVVVYLSAIKPRSGEISELVSCYLSSTTFDNKTTDIDITVYPAPATIVADMKAEIARQEKARPQAYRERLEARVAAQQMEKEKAEQAQKEMLKKLAEAAAKEEARKQAQAQEAQEKGDNAEVH